MVIECMMCGMSWRHLAVLQCESTIPSVSAALSSLLWAPVSDFYTLMGCFFLLALPIYLPLEVVMREFRCDQVQGVSARAGEEHEVWLAHKRERDEGLVRGEGAGPEEPEPTAEVEVPLEHDRHHNVGRKVCD